MFEPHFDQATYIRIAVAGVVIHVLGFIIFSAAKFGGPWVLAYRGLDFDASKLEKKAPEPEPEKPKARGRSPSPSRVGARGRSASPARGGANKKAKPQPSKEDQSHMMFQHAANIAIGAVTAFVLEALIQGTQCQNLEESLQCAFYCWLGFDAGFALFNYIWLASKPPALFIDLGYHLVKMLVIAAVLRGPLYSPK